MVAMSDETAVPDERIGQIFGRHRILRVLGRGGMSVVYEAVHVDIGQRAALKLLHPALATQVGYRERFFREALAASKVQHPGLVRVSDFGEHSDGTLYLLMEFLEGPTLRELLEQTEGNRLPIALSLYIGLQLASALASAHKSSVIHCDLKPDNVKWVEDSEASFGHRIKILDFGIARISDNSTPPTLHNIGLSGTPAYMSPERCAGQRAVDGKTDVYALGCILFELLSSRTPFVGQAADLLINHRYSDPQPIHELVAEVPDEVDAFLSTLLHKRPEDRPTMQETAERLAPLLAGCQNGTLKNRQNRRGWLARLGTSRPFGAAWLLGLATLASGTGYWYFRYISKMVPLWGGDFIMGWDNTSVAMEELQKAHVDMGYSPEEWDTIAARSAPRRLVQIRSFFIDRTEVACSDVAKWMQYKYDNKEISVEYYVENGVGYHVVYIGEMQIANLYYRQNHTCIKFDSKNRKFVPIEGREMWPANSISWYGADAYCRDRGARLPTEAEWEFAARNRGVSVLPWGSRLVPCDGLVIERDPEDPNSKYKRCRDSGAGLANIGTGKLDRTRNGVWDMAGSVMEWVSDCYRAPYSLLNTDNPRVESDTDSGVFASNCSKRVLRGGGWSGPYLHMFGFSRSPEKPDAMPAYAGFRCAKDL